VTDAGGLTDTATVTVTLTNANEAPVLPDAAFSLPENSANGSPVGAVTASDPDAGDTASYAITAGNTGGAFAIDATTGAITVANASALDFETTPVFTLTVQVTDAGGLTGTATVTVSLSDVDERPIAFDAWFPLAETAQTGTLVGVLAARDPDAGDALTFAITDGNRGGAFAIDPRSGAITVAEEDALDFETTPRFRLTVVVTDASGLSQTVTVTVGITDVSEASFEVLEPGEAPIPDPQAPTDGPLEVPADVPVPPPVSDAAPSGPALLLANRFEWAGSVAPTRNGPATGPSEMGAAEPRRNTGAPAVPASAIDQEKLLEALQRLRRELDDDPRLAQQENLTLTVEGAALVVSSGLLALLLRGGSLAAAALSSLPLWRRVDPLAVLALSDEERWRREQDIRAAQSEEESGRLLDTPRGERDAAQEDDERRPRE